MRGLVTALLAGAVFGAGLLISGMTNPAKVQGWLDVFGDWDITLGFVLTGAIIPMAIAWRIAARYERAANGTHFPAAPLPIIDAKLMGGAALFGLGWGFSGLCPGPAMASLLFGGVPILVFFAAMVAGMAIVGMTRKT